MEQSLAMISSLFGILNYSNFHFTIRIGLGPVDLKTHRLNINDYNCTANAKTETMGCGHMAEKLAQFPIMN